MKSKAKPSTFSRKMLTLSVLLALSAYETALAVDEADPVDKDYPFAAAPQNLSSRSKIMSTEVKQDYTRIHTEQKNSTEQTLTSFKGAKPNVMLYLDDSSSMSWRVNERDWLSPIRIRVLQQSMGNIVDKYRDKVRWGTTAFNASNWNIAIGDDWSKVRDWVRKWPANGNTPLFRSLPVAVDALDKGIQYRCQKNFLVILTDGDSNTNRVKYRWRSPKVSQYAHFPYYEWLMINEDLNSSKYPQWRKVFAGKLENKSGSKYQSMCNASFYDWEYKRSTICQQLPDQFVYYPYTGISEAAFYSLASVTTRFGSSFPRLEHQDFPSSASSRFAQLKGSLGVPLFGTEPLPQGNSGPFAGSSYLRDNAHDFLKYLTDALYYGDLRSSTHGDNGTDAAGGDWDDKNFRQQNITTYVISFGTDVSPYGGAMLGEGGSKIMLDGKEKRAYFEARSQEDLEKAFNSIFSNIEKSIVPEQGDPITLPVSEHIDSTQPPVPGADVTVPLIRKESAYASTTPATGGSAKELPNMAVSIYLPPGLTSTELRFHKLDLKGNVVKKTNGEPDYVLADFSQRKALIHDGKGVSWSDKPNESVLNNDFFNLGKDTQHSGRVDEWKKALLPWVIRQAKNDQEIKDQNYPTPYRVRLLPESHDMGDVLDTPVLAAGRNGAKQGNREEFLITASNDGMVYLFQSNPEYVNGVSTKGAPYSLKLNYMPAYMPRTTDSDTLAKHLKHLAHENYIDSAHPHRYLINGGITVRTTAGENGRIFLAGAMGQGGRGMYALNVGGAGSVNTGVGLHAKPENWNTSVPLFEVRANDSKGFATNLGYTVSTPQIARISTSYSTKNENGVNKWYMTNGRESNIRYAIFLASGYNKQAVSQETALYVYEALGSDVGTAKNSVQTSKKPGELWSKITVLGGKGGLSSPTLLDVNFDGVVDYAFAGDYAGNMYRFDLRKLDFKNSGSSNVDAVKQIYKGTAGKSQPITSAPAISHRGNGRYVIIWGTGSDIYDTDFNNTDEQGVYGVYQRFDADLNPVDPRTALDQSTKPEGQLFPVSADDLLLQNLTANGKYRTVTNNAIFKKNADGKDSSELIKLGWRVPFTGKDGERVVVKPTMMQGTVVLTSRIYNTKVSKEINEEPWNKDNPLDNGWELKVEQPKYDQKFTEWTPWGVTKIETNHSDPTGNSKDVCIGDVTTKTKVEQRTRTETYSDLKRYEKIIPSETRSSGWILLFNAENGGQIDVSKGTGIDFEGKYTREAINKFKGSDNAPVYQAGMLTEDGHASFAFLSGTASRTEDGSQAALTPDGDSGSSGKDEDLKKVGKPEDCYASDDQYILTSSSSTGLGNTYNVYGKICPKNKKMRVSRLSWREIY